MSVSLSVSSSVKMTLTKKMFYFMHMYILIIPYKCSFIAIYTENLSIALLFYISVILYSLPDIHSILVCDIHPDALLYTASTHADKYNIYLLRMTTFIFKPLAYDMFVPQ